MNSKITKFQDIPKYIGVAGAYQVEVPLIRLMDYLKDFEEDYGLELNPDFQRGRVWTDDQKVKYLEFFLSGGMSGNTLYFNSPIYNGAEGEDISDTTVICVDGLQRISAVDDFVNNKIKVFGSYFKEFTDMPRDGIHRFKVCINGLTRKKDILTWYVQLNEGGTPHSSEEIARVKQMITDIK